MQHNLQKVCIKYNWFVSETSDKAANGKFRNISKIYYLDFVGKNFRNYDYRDGDRCSCLYLHKATNNASNFRISMLLYVVFSYMCFIFVFVQLK